MTGKHRNWHRHWVVDLAAGTATHDSGMVVRFEDGILLPKPDVGTYCLADGIGEWTGTPANGDDTLREFLRKNQNLRDAASIEARIGRLMDEAGRIWARAQADARLERGY